MKRPYSSMGCIAAAALLLTGCIDGNYDLSDIDTTTRVSVNDLTVPVQLKPIILENIIEIEGNENIKVMEINGEKIYAIEKSGEVTTSDVSINPIKINTPYIPDSYIDLSGVLPAYAPKRAAGVSQDVLDRLTVEYPIDSKMESSFQFDAQGIDEAVEEISDVTSVNPVTLGIRLVLPSSFANLVGKVTFENAVIELPKGLYMDNNTPAATSLGTYDPVNGLLTINQTVQMGSNNEINITVIFNRFDAKVADIKIQNNSLHYSGNIGLIKPEDPNVKSSIKLTPSGQLNLPTSLRLTAKYELNSFYIASFSGRVNYLLKGINIDPIDLSSLPDFLNDPETNIILGNPQIYLSALNTTADYHTGLSGVLALNSKFASGDVRQAVSEGFEVESNRGVTYYNIALTESKNSKLDLEAQYPNPNRTEFPGLTTILTNGNEGLPRTISISLDNLAFGGDALNFPIRHGWNTNEGTVAPLKGRYTFFAPLSFQNGSQIIYAKTETGLGSDDLNKLFVTRLHLTAHAVNTLPVEVVLKAYPVDYYSNPIGECLQELVLEPGTSQIVNLEIGGYNGNAFNNLDGITYRAEVKAGQNAASLSPDQTITLSDLRITVDGYYDTDF